MLSNYFLDGWIMAEWIDGWVDGWVSEWIDRLIGGCMDRLVWMDG